MTELDKKAVEILNDCDSRFYIDLIDPLRVGFGDAVLAYEDGVLTNVRRNWMFMAQSEKRAVEFCEFLKHNFNKVDCVVVHDAPFVDVGCDILNLKPGVPCYVGARFSKEKFNIQTDIEIKKLTHDFDNLVWNTYGFFKGQPWGLKASKHSIDAGMYGGFKNGDCVGFIGTHSEGTMGMLEILPQYRRHGYGEALEMYLANDFIDQGRVPYCHIWETNEASLKLQAKMGFWLSDGKRLNWLQDD